MLVQAYHLEKKLAEGLPALAWVSGDETLLVAEACDALLATAKAQGFSEREQVYLETNPKWDNLFAASMSTSLFGDKKILDVRLNTLKLGRDGAKQIEQWLQMLDGTVFVLIRSAKLSQAEKKLKWFKLLDSAGWVTQVWPIDGQQLPRWIIDRARSKGLAMQTEAAEVLALKVEGNLLAAKQEIDKLALLQPDNSQVDADTIYYAVSDSAHYDVFKLADSMLGGDIQKTIKIFRALLTEGVALQVILWAIIKDVRELAAMESSGQSVGAHQPIEYVPPSIWQKRLPLLMQALQRKRGRKFGTLLADLLVIDKASKGLGSASVERTEQLLLQLAGRL